MATCSLGRIRPKPQKSFIPLFVFFVECWFTPYFLNKRLDNCGGITFGSLVVGHYGAYFGVQINFYLSLPSSIEGNSGWYHSIRGDYLWWNDHSDSDVSKLGIRPSMLGIKCAFSWWVQLTGCSTFAGDEISAWLWVSLHLACALQTLLLCYWWVHLEPSD